MKYNFQLEVYGKKMFIVISLSMHEYRYNNWPNKKGQWHSPIG